MYVSKHKTYQKWGRHCLAEQCWRTSNASRKLSFRTGYRTRDLGLSAATPNHLSCVHCSKSDFRVVSITTLGTRLNMSTADHSQTYGQTESSNRFVEDTLRGICADASRRWSYMLPVVEFALNNSVHDSSGYKLFFVNDLTHPRGPSTLPNGGLRIGGRDLPIVLLMSAQLLFRSRCMCSPDYAL